MDERKLIAEKWYKRFNYPAEMDEHFYRALEEADIPAGLTAENAETLLGLGTQGTVWALYFLEETEKEYKRRGLEYRFEDDVKRISERIARKFKNTGSIDIGDLTWDRHFFMAREFRLGRLVFCLGQAVVDMPTKDIKKGDNVVIIHVPGGEPLLYDACVESLENAKVFIKKHFPDFKYRYFSGVSWLLDTSIADLLGENSNVLKFGTLFEPVITRESDNIIKFVFGGGATRKDLPNIEPKNRFQRELKEAALAGRVFYDVRGVIDSWK